MGLPWDKLGRGAAALASPLQLGNVAAWYDLGDASSVKVDSSMRCSLVADKSGNSSVNCLCLNGASGNYASVPDSAATSVTGDIDIRVCAALNDWTPAGDQTLIAKRAGAGQFSYQLDVKLTTGLLYFYISTDGTANIANISSVAPTVSDFGTLWIRVTRVASSGLTTFYTGSDGTSWTQLGTTVNAGTGTIFDSTSNTEIGSTLVGTTNTVAGKIYRAQVYNGIAGTLALDANFAVPAKLATSFTESSVNAATVTINTSGDTGARICGERDLVNLTVANQPIYLQWSGGNFSFGNASGSAWTTPDSAATSLTAEIDVRVKVWPNAITSAVDRGLWTKGYGSGWYFILTPSGNPYFGFLNITPVLRSVNSGYTLTTADIAAPIWLRFTRVSASGTYFFYKSPDGSNWSQIGTGTLAAGENMVDRTESTSVTDCGSGDWTRCYYGELRSTVNGTVVASFDPSLYKGGTSFVASTGETWTVGGSAIIATGSCLYFNGATQYNKAAACSLPQPVSRYFVGENVTWTSGRYIMDGNTGGQFRLVQFGGTPSVINDDGGVNGISTWPLATNAVISEVHNGAASKLRYNRGAANTTTIAKTPNGFILGAEPTPSLYSNIAVSEIAIYSAAHGTATQDRVTQYLGNKWRIAV